MLRSTSGSCLVSHPSAQACMLACDALPAQVKPDLSPASWQILTLMHMCRKFLAAGHVSSWSTTHQVAAMVLLLLAVAGIMLAARQTGSRPGKSS